MIFLMIFGGSREGPNPWIYWQGQYFRGFTPFRPGAKTLSKMSSKMIKKYPPKIKLKSNTKYDEILNRFWMDLGCILEAKFDAFGNQNGIKKALKNQSNFVGDFGRKNWMDGAGDAETILSPAECAGCLDSEFARISPHSSSHALLPQRGAADSNAPRIPPGQT